MDSVSGGESIRALILREMALFTNGQLLYLIWSYSSLFIAFSAVPIIPSLLQFFLSKRLCFCLKDVQEASDHRRKVK